MYWKASGEDQFIASDIIAFAQKNDWLFVDSAVYTANQTSGWTYNSEPIVPLSHKGFADSASNISTYIKFPRWFDGDIKLYRFKTGWLAIEPGTDDGIEENGLVLLNRDNTKMAVYHLWGE